MPLPPGVIAAMGGSTLLVLAVFQVLTGKRVIKLGHNHLKIHTWTAYAMLALAVVHGGAGLYFFVL
jgi:hypothetical protein